MDVAEDETLADGYKLKLNSYDLGVDIELADAIQRTRPHLADWAPTLAPLLGIDLGRVDGLNLAS